MVESNIMVVDNMNRGVRYFLPGGIDDDEDDDKGSSSMTIVTIATFINQYTRKYTPLYYYISTYPLLEVYPHFICLLCNYYYYKHWI